MTYDLHPTVLVVKDDRFIGDSLRKLGGRTLIVQLYPQPGPEQNAQGDTVELPYEMFSQTLGDDMGHRASFVDISDKPEIEARVVKTTALPAWLEPIRNRSLESLLNPFSEASPAPEPFLELD